jgi:GDP-L-fucose synthase
VPSTLYGPDYHTDGRQMHFIFDLVRKIIAGKERGRPVELWGDGHQARELVHVRDFVDVCVKLSDQAENELVNVGGGEEHSIREFADMLCDIIGYDAAAITYDTGKYTGARSKVLDVGKLRRLLPDLGMTPLKAGLKETADWFRTAHA